MCILHQTHHEESAGLIHRADTPATDSTHTTAPAAAAADAPAAVHFGAIG
jgi:hypothetical protein